MHLCVTYAIFKNALNIHRVMGAQVSNVTAIPVKWQFQVQLQMDVMQIPSGKLSHNYGKPPFFMGKSTLKFLYILAIFNSYKLVYRRVPLWIICNVSKAIGSTIPYSS